MLKPSLLVGLMTVGLVLSASVMASGQRTYITHEVVNEHPTIVYHPGYNPPHVRPERPNHRPQRPHRPNYRPQPTRHCVSAQHVGNLLGQQANNIHVAQQARQINRRDAARLNGQLNTILRTKDSYLRDGCLTSHENQQLVHLLNQLARDIRASRQARYYH